MKEGLKIILMWIGIILLFFLTAVIVKAIVESSLPLWVKFWLLR